MPPSRLSDWLLPRVAATTVMTSMSRSADGSDLPLEGGVASKLRWIRVRLSGYWRWVLGRASIRRHRVPGSAGDPSVASCL